MPQTPRVFISYARKDGEAFAADLVRRIEQAEIPVWRDRDGLRGGEGGRLVHHSVILELNLPSYRLEKSKEQRATQTSDPQREP